jgi:hypothetical protein
VSPRSDCHASQGAVPAGTDQAFFFFIASSFPWQDWQSRAYSFFPGGLLLACVRVLRRLRRGRSIVELCVHICCEALQVAKSVAAATACVAWILSWRNTTTGSILYLPSPPVKRTGHDLSCLRIGICSRGLVDRKVWLIVQPWVILDGVQKATAGGQVCFT